MNLSDSTDSQSKDQVCPLCNQPTGRRQQTKTQPLGRTITSIIEDVECWAEGDVLATDSETLKPEDLVNYLAKELAPVLMKMYARRVRHHRAEHQSLSARVAAEREVVAAVEAGLTLPKSLRGAPRKEFCIRGHKRTPENIDLRGRCKPCRRLDRMDEN